MLFYQTALPTQSRNPNLLTPLISHDLEIQRNQFNQWSELSTGSFTRTRWLNSSLCIFLYELFLCAKWLNSNFNHGGSCLAAGVPKAGPRALLLNMCRPWGWEGKSCQCHRTRRHHLTGWETQTRAATGERSTELSLTLQFSLLWQPQASETISESAGYFKTQSSNSPPKNMYSVDVFKAGFLILSGRQTCYDRRVRELRAWLQPSSAPASCTAMHEPPGTRSPRKIFYPLQHLCSSVSQRSNRGGH